MLLSALLLTGILLTVKFQAVELNVVGGGGGGGVGSYISYQNVA